MKVIFLDIDGVLNSHRSCMAYNGFPHAGESEVDGKWHKLDQVAVHLLRSIVEKSGAKVVLSSTWRIGADREWLNRFGAFIGVDIIDVTRPTGSLDGETEPRGYQIQDWIDDNPSVTHYAIIDDDSDMLESQKDHFIKTTHADGLSYHNYLDCLRVLGAVK